MSMSKLETRRLVLRPFLEQDLDAVYKIFGDLEVNRFLPWFPVRTMEEAGDFYEKRLKGAAAGGAGVYYETEPYYGICLRGTDCPIGYVNLTLNDSYDLGYGLCREFWHRGIATEAAGAVVEQLRREGVPCVTATHDVKNPGSGEVMRRLGMKYCYSYEEQWQPKNILVTFRLYQLNLDGQKDRVYRKYWENSAVHYVESLDGDAERFEAAFRRPDFLRTGEERRGVSE